MLWKQAIGSCLSNAAFTEDSSHLLAVGRGMFKVTEQDADPWTRIDGKLACAPNA